MGNARKFYSSQQSHICRLKLHHWHYRQKEQTLWRIIPHRLQGQEDRAGASRIWQEMLSPNTLGFCKQVALAAEDPKEPQVLACELDLCRRAQMCQGQAGNACRQIDRQPEVQWHQTYRCLLKRISLHSRLCRSGTSLHSRLC